MEYYIKRLPKEYSNDLRKKIEEYNRSNGTDKSLGNEIVSLIFDCVSKYPNSTLYLSAICRFQFNENFGNHFQKIISNRVDDIILDIRNSDPDRCLKIQDETWWILVFIADALRGRGEHMIIADLFQSIACNCKTKYSGNICENPACVDDQVSQKQFDELSLKSEYPIKCGILILDWFQNTRIGKEVLVLSLYWQKRLRKFSCYFGKNTQKMIADFSILDQFDSEIELKKHYDERIENEKLKHQENIEELNRENEKLKNESLTEKSELQKMNQELNQRIEQMTKDMEIFKKNEEQIKAENVTKTTDFENEKLKYQNNIAELNRENETLKERMKKTEEQLKSEEETNEILENLMADNDELTIKCVELKSQLKREGIQIMDFKFKIEELEKTIEKQASNPKNAFKALIKCPNICRIFEKYEKILMTDINLLYPTIKSNINKLLQIQPDSVEILTMKVDILNFEKKIEEYLRRVNEDYWKIARNPDISMKELGEEIETIPSDEFMEKYRKLIKENDLKA